MQLDQSALLFEVRQKSKIKVLNSEMVGLLGCVGTTAVLDTAGCTAFTNSMKHLDVPLF